MKLVRWLVSALLCGGIVSHAATATPVTLESKSLAVSIDPAFPRIVQYREKITGETMEGQTSPASVVELNGKAAPCRVQFRKIDAGSAEYVLIFDDAKIQMNLLVSVGTNMVELRATSVRENGAEKLRTLFFPDNALLTVRGSQANTAMAALYATCMNDNCGGVFREKIAPLADVKAGSDTGNYFFLSSGRLAAGIADNNIVDVQRTAWKVAEAGGVKTLTAWCPAWIYRVIDTETTLPPCTRIFVTADRNGDGKADWQDAALVYRATMPKPYGHEFVRTTVGENIAMNFASGAQQPFLRILDEVKKIWLATDGIGNQIVIKGFSSEGHDSANTDYGGHYNGRAGGLKDFTTLLAHAREYNARIGIHINASEVYPEAHRYKPEILQRDAKGNPKGGWTWLDHAHMIDKTKDTTSGQLYAALDEMRRELPNLDFVYVDTYWEHGWPAWKIVTKLNNLGLPMYTEGDLPLDPWTTWSHWRGGGSVISRFIWYSDRDIFNNDAILRGGRADSDGVRGWQNQHSFNNFIVGTFARNLPAKYLKQFELQRWVPGSEAVFSDGVKVVKTGDKVVVTRNDRVVMTWTGGGANSQLFVPWDGKIYLWNDTGAETTWDLPWTDCREVFLYRLTTMGRVDEKRIPVANGKVSLTVEKGTPYVMYPKKAPAQKPIEWGEGGPVKDPGFDSHGFAAWQLETQAMSARIEDDSRGNARLVIGGPGAILAQEMRGLEAGKTYAATVWTQVKGRRRASLIVQVGGASFSNAVTRTNVRHNAPNDPRRGSNYQRLRVVFDVPAGGGKAAIVLRAGEGDASSEVEFDDVRVVETQRSPEAAKHYFWEDFEHVETGGYGPFTCCPGERTHLSEANPPHTKDTINGQFSLKSRDSGRVVRTLPSSLLLKRNTRYRLSCETLTDDSAGKNRVTVEDGAHMLFEAKFPAGRGRIAGEFVTGNDDDGFVALYRTAGDMIVIDDFAIDEIGPAPDQAGAAGVAIDEKLPGRSIVLDETFAKPLSADWKIVKSPQPGTSVGVADDALNIDAGANVSALIERALPAGTTAVECRLTPEGEDGQTWGVGLALFWADGKALRVNLRGPDGRFGVDSTAGAQAIVGELHPEGVVTLRIRVDADKVTAEARNEGGVWQTLATFAREKFAGDPAMVRVGKMHGVEGTNDHSDPGATGNVAVHLVRVYGK